MCGLFSFALRRGTRRTVILALAALSMLGLPRQVAAQPAPKGGSIHGYVGVRAPTLQDQPQLAGGSSIQPGALISVPNITVTAQNVSTNLASGPVVTNPQGYFRTPDLPAGKYRICVSGAGFASTCDDAIVDDIGPYAVVDHIVLIRPAKSAIIGTVTLADRRTPCFWFRPSINAQALTARVSMQSLDGKVIAGPVDGNVAGQYVLPLAQTVDRVKLHVECDAGVAETNLAVRGGVTTQDIVMAASVPTILAFDFTKNGVGIRRADPGDTVTVTVLAKDPDGNTLHYAWVDDNGRAVNLPDAPTVQWPLPAVAGTNTLRVQVSNGKGGVVWYSRAIQSGPNAIFFSGHVFNRQTNAGVAGATISLNGATVTTDEGGNFQESVPDASRFVLNATHPGFALSSLVLINQVAAVQVPLDPVQTVTVNGATGGPINVPPGSPAACNCKCKTADDDGRFRILVEIPETRIDIHHGEEKGATPTQSCPSPTGGASNLGITFQPGSFATGTGATYTGTVSVEAFQYDLNQPNPIPGDFGAIHQGQVVRLGTFGAFHLLPRDAQGNPLAMVAGKQASVSMPIQPGQLAVAPATIPLFHYDENSGNWLDDGTLTRSGNQYVGQITHFSVFNADTVFPGGACVKVLLPASGSANAFTMPVTLNGTYYDPSVGTFHHPNVQTSDTTIGIERLVPNQLFTLTVTDSATPTPNVVTAALNSGPGLSVTQFPSGYDTLPNGQLDLTFSACNGPVNIDNVTLSSYLKSSTSIYFLGPAFGGSITNNSATYQQATQAGTGGNRATLSQWKAVNGFTQTSSFTLNAGQTAGLQGQYCSAPNQGEVCALYFNNGDLKFGRDMHCRVTNANGATACYVANFGVVGTDDAQSALKDALLYESSGQSTSPSVTQPTATVTMEYDPVSTDPLAGVQFWAYHGDGSYFAQPALDNQGPKPIPDICTACHQGGYSSSTQTAQGSSFLPFDLDSFLDSNGPTNGTPFPSDAASAFVTSQQQAFHTLNNMISAIAQAQNPQVTAIAQLIQPPPSPSKPLWYSNTTPSVQFTFGQGAQQLPLIPPPWSSAPGNDPFSAGHEPLYDSVVKVVCRTCHVAVPSGSGNIQWNAYSEMSGSEASFIQQFACGPAAYAFSPMPHAEVPWLRYWQQSLATTLAGELSLNSCPPPP